VRLSLQQSDYFWADLAKQVDWYRAHATPEVAARFVDAAEQTLHKLTKTPGIGRLRFVGWPQFEGMHSLRVQRPFHRFLIFYRYDSSTLFA
jgi:plasmid stabilization system protein ParE